MTANISQTSAAGNDVRHEIAFILDNVSDWQTLTLGVPAGVEVVVIDSRGDGLAQIAEHLAGKAPGSVDAIHLLGHGRSGEVNLGGVSLNSDNLDHHADTLAQIGHSLTEEGDILLYGCNVAAGQAGVEFVQRLGNATGGDVAASDDLTGASQLGGDWILEVSPSEVNTLPVVNGLDAYLGLLSNPPVLDLNGSDTGTGRTVALADAANGLAAATAEASDVEQGALNGGAGNWNGASLSVQRIKSGGAADGSAHDVFSFTSSSTFTFTGGSMVQGSDSTGTLTTSPGGTPFATWSYTSASGKLDISFDTNATSALVQDVVRHIGYSNATPYGDATIRMVLNDGTSTSNADVTVTSTTIHVDQTAFDTQGDAADGFNLAEALAVAKNGDSLLIHDGTYRGQFVATKAVTIDALNGIGHVTLEAPDAADLVDSTQKSLRDKVRIPILDIRHDDPAAGTTTVKNISIDGRYQARLISERTNSNGDEDLIGIAVYNSNAEIDGVTISHIATALEPNGDYSGYSENYGIMAEGGSGLATVANVTVKNSTIGTFQKTGIIAWGPELNVDIHDNTITLVGALGKSNQNGMQIGSSGARTGTTGTISNNQINNIGTTSTEYSATGILLRQIGAGFTVSGNTLSSNGALGAGPTLGSTGIGLFEVGQAVTISSNDFSQITGGIVAEAPLGPLNTYDAAHVIQCNNFASTHTAIYDSQDSSPWNSAVNKLAANPLTVTVNSSATVSNGRGFLDYVLFGGADSFSDTGAAPSRIDSGSGNDTVTAGSGADTLIGGPGNDSLNGGGGADTLLGDSTVTLAADAGVAVTNWADAAPASLSVAGLTAIAVTASDSIAIGRGLTFSDPSYVDEVVNGTGGAVAIGSAGKIVQYTGTWSGGVFTSTTKADANAILLVWDADGTGAGTVFKAVVLTGVTNTMAVGTSGTDTLTGGDGNDIFMFACSDNGIDRITDFGIGDAIRVIGRQSTGGTVTTGNGSSVAANSVQVGTSSGVTTLHIDADAVGDAAELQIELTGTYLPGNFVLDGESIRYRSAITFGSVAFGNDTGASNSDLITKTAAQTITATLSSAPGSGDVVWGSLDGGTNWVNVTSKVSGTTLTWDGVTLSSGSNTLKFKIIDSAGNDGVVTSQAYELDTVAPTTGIATKSLSADSGFSATDFITNVAAQTISGTLNAVTVAGEVVQVSLDNGVTWIDATNTIGQNAWSLSGQTLSGSGTLKIRVVDLAGNAGPVSSQSYSFDNTAPTLNATGSRPADNATNVAVSMALTVKFAEALDASSDLTKVYLKDVATDTLVPAVVTLNASGEMVITPNARLVYSSAYYVTWDADALKDAAGNAAAASVDETIYNFTTTAAPSDPPPPPPVIDPTDPPLPDQWPDLPDVDGDGVPEVIEDLVPSLPPADGQAPVSGDGNGDGVPDRQQIDVASIPFRNTETISQNPQAPVVFVTLVAGSNQGAPSGGGRIISASQLDAPPVGETPGQRPADLELPLGLISFTATTDTPEAPTSFSLFVSGDIPINGYWKPTTSGWVNLASPEYGGQMVSEGGRTRLDFVIVDNSPFDNDPSPEVIRDPGGPGYLLAPPPSTDCPYDPFKPDTDRDGMPDVIEADMGRNASVKDNDVFGNDELFVSQLYRDLLCREGEAAGVKYWQQNLAQGQNRAELVSTFLSSAEFDANAGAVARLYHAVLGRSPDYCGFNYWLGEGLDGLSAKDMGMAFLQSAEFAGSNPSLSNEAFVDLLYQNVLGRSADTAGKAYWLDQMAQGSSRGEVLYGFAQSAEYKAAMADEVVIDLLYLGLLDRAPEQAGWDYWHGQWTQFDSPTQFYSSAMQAPEYHDRFLPAQIGLVGGCAVEV